MLLKRERRRLQSRECIEHTALSGKYSMGSFRLLVSGTVNSGHKVQRSGYRSQVTIPLHLRRRVRFLTSCTVLFLASFVGLIHFPDPPLKCCAADAADSSASNSMPSAA